MSLRVQFKSTAALTTRVTRNVPTVERATFVVFSVGGVKFAAPVESIERVLNWAAHAAASATSIEHAGRDVPLVDFASHLGLMAIPFAVSRALVVQVAGGWIAVVVDAVHDVSTIDASAIEIAPNGMMTSTFPGGVPDGVRGHFKRGDTNILVLDVGRALGYRLA